MKAQVIAPSAWTKPPVVEKKLNRDTFIRKMSPMQRYEVIAEWLKKNPAAPQPKTNPLVQQPEPTDQMAHETVAARCLQAMGMQSEAVAFNGAGSRNMRSVEAREVMYAILRAYQPHGRTISFPMIGLIVLGRTCHGTVITSLNRWSLSHRKLERAKDVAAAAGLHPSINQALDRLHMETSLKFTERVLRRDVFEKRHDPTNRVDAATDARSGGEDHDVERDSDQPPAGSPTGTQGNDEDAAGTCGVVGQPAGEGTGRSGGGGDEAWVV